MLLLKVGPMARRGISETDVFAACDKLQADFGDFTLQEIREALGGKGSFSTISKHYNNWQVTQEFKKEQTLKQKILKEQPEETITQEQADALRLQIENLSKELFEVKSSCLSLEEKNRQISKERDIAVAQIETLEKVNSQLLSSYRDMESRFKGFYEYQVKQIMDDLQAVNLATQDKVHEISMQSQNVWLQEKIKLKEAADTNKKLVEENRALSEKLARSDKVVAPLKRQIAHLEKVLHKYVTFEQLQEGVS